MRYYRVKHDDAIYHITTRCNNKELLFKQDMDFSKYLQTLSLCKDKHNFLLHNYIIMPNHTHLIIKPIKTTDISPIMQAINRQYARWYNSYHERKGHFWESRFDSTVIADDRQMLATLRYIDLNAVKAGLCKYPVDWKYSGADFYLNGKKNVLLDIPETYRSLGLNNESRQKAYRTILSLPI